MSGLVERSGVPGWLLRFLRVPEQPSPPTGAESSLRIFRAAPAWFRYRCIRWVFKQIGALVGLVVGYYYLSGFLNDVVPSELPFGQFHRWFVGIELLGLLSFLGQLPVSFLMLKLDYEYRWYMITDRSLRIREGIVKIREQTMSFANIQNVSVEQGPVQRFFGIADLKVRTAGGGDDSDSGNDSDDHDANLHIGYFRGLDDVESVRNAILSRQRRLRHSGLGDPDEFPSDGFQADKILPDGVSGAEPDRASHPADSGSRSTPASADLLAAAHELLGEAVALRSALR